MRNESLQNPIPDADNQAADFETNFQPSDRRDIIAGVVSDVTMYTVPASLEHAEGIVETLRGYDAGLHANIEADPSLKEQIGGDTVDALHDAASAGINNWRLTQQKRAEWAEAASAQNVKRLSPDMRSLMDKLGGADATAVEKLATLQKQARDRLKLDEEIEAKYGNENPDVVASKAAGTETPEPHDTPHSSTPRSRRATRATGPSPYGQGDGMIHPSEKQPQEPQGEVSSTRKHRRATRAATEIPSTETGSSVNEAEDSYVGRHEAPVPPENVNVHHLPVDSRGKEVELWRAEKKQVVPVKAAEETNYPGGLTESQWEMLTDVEKARIELSVAQDAFENAKGLSPRERNAAYFKLQDAEKAARKAERKENGVRSRVKNLMSRAAAHANTAVSNTVEYYTDAEKRGDRLLDTALVAGAIGLIGAGVVYVAHRAGMNMPTGGNLATLMNNKPHDTAGKQQALAEAHAHLGNFNTGPAVEKVHESVKLHAGDTIWSEGRANLIAHGNHQPSIAQINEEKDRLLRLNGLNEEGAKHLRVGYNVKLR